MSDQPTTPEPKNPDTPCRCGGRRPSSCSPLWAIIVFAIYSVLYEAIIWGIFGWAVFIDGNSGWWILVAIICSGAQLKPKHFGIGVFGENDSEQTTPNEDES